MNRIDPKQAVILLFVLFVIAWLINGTQGIGGRREAVSRPTVVVSPAPFVPSPAQLAAEKAAAEHVKFLERYLVGGSTRQAGSRNVAIVVSTDDGKKDRVLTAALTRRFQGDSIQILSSFFKPEFVSDGLFNEAFDGSNELFAKLELAKSLDALLLAREHVQYSENTALQNVITATLGLEVAVVPVSGQGDSKTWKFSAVGPGFTKEVARQAAEERLLKQIAADTKMSLSP